MLYPESGYHLHLNEMVHLSKQSYVQKHLDKATKHLAGTSSSGVHTQIKFSWTEIYLRHLSYNIEHPF